MKYWIIVLVLIFFFYVEAKEWKYCSEFVADPINPSEWVGTGFRCAAEDGTIYDELEKYLNAKILAQEKRIVHLEEALKDIRDIFHEFSWQAFTHMSGVDKRQAFIKKY